MTSSSGFLAFMGGDDAPLARIEALLARPAWHADAACKEHPEVSWFPGLGERTEPAKAVCHGCSVQAECLAAALELGEHFGVWGGTSERERRRLRGRRSREPLNRCEHSSRKRTRYKDTDELVCSACRARRDRAASIAA